MNIEERKKEILEIKNQTYNYILDHYRNRSIYQNKNNKNFMIINVNISDIMMNFNNQIQNISDIQDDLEEFIINTFIKEKEIDDIIFTYFDLRKKYTKINIYHNIKYKSVFKIKFDKKTFINNKKFNYYNSGGECLLFNSTDFHKPLHIKFTTYQDWLTLTDKIYKKFME